MSTFLPPGGNGQVAQAQTPGAWVESQIGGWNAELADYLAEQRNFPTMDPAEVFLLVAGHYSRAAEIRHYVVRGGSRGAEAFLNRVVDPFIQATERQYTVFSRLAAVREAELKLSGDKRLT